MSATRVSTDVVELTTTVRFTGAGDVSAARIADELESAIQAEIQEQGIAAIRGYFARPVGSTVQVGLRFRGMDASHVESSADDVLTAALDRVRALEHAEARGKRTSTLLVGA